MALKNEAAGNASRTCMRIKKGHESDEANEKVYNSENSRVNQSSENEQK